MMLSKKAFRNNLSTLHIDRPTIIIMMVYRYEETHKDDLYVVTTALRSRDGKWNGLVFEETRVVIYLDTFSVEK